MMGLKFLLLGKFVNLILALVFVHFRVPRKCSQAAAASAETCVFRPKKGSPNDYTAS